MRRLYLLLFTALSLPLAFSCQQDEPAPDCATPATIRDLTGLDGCGFVLELDNGQRLEPHGTPWTGYDKHDGERVTISYVADPAVSICMAGESVRLTCIQQQVSWCGTPPTGRSK